jgi:hypothetical protein
MRLQLQRRENDGAQEHGRGGGGVGAAQARSSSGGGVDRAYREATDGRREAAAAALAADKLAVIARKLAAAQHLFGEAFTAREAREREMRRTAGAVYAVESRFVRGRWARRLVTPPLEELAGAPLHFTLLPRAVFDELGGGGRTLGEAEWARLSAQRPCLADEKELLALLRQGRVAEARAAVEEDERAHRENAAALLRGARAEPSWNTDARIRVTRAGRGQGSRSLEVAPHTGPFEPHARPRPDARPHPQQRGCA